VALPTNLTLVVRANAERRRVHNPAQRREESSFHEPLHLSRCLPLTISLITDDSIELKLLATLSVWPYSLTIQAEGSCSRLFTFQPYLKLVHSAAVPQPVEHSLFNTPLCLHWPTQPRERILLRYTRKTPDVTVTPDHEIALLTPNLHFGLRSLSCAQPFQDNQGTNLQVRDLDWQAL
jgi:hypothetical protein